MGLKIIRAGSSYGLVIAVSPENATLDFPNAKYFIFADWEIRKREPLKFHEINQEETLSYFSGQADGCGFEEIPNRIFQTIEELTQFVLNIWDTSYLTELEANYKDPPTGGWSDSVLIATAEDLGIATEGKHPFVLNREIEEKFAEINRRKKESDSFNNVELLRDLCQSNPESAAKKFKQVNIEIIRAIAQKVGISAPDADLRKAVAMAFGITIE